MIRPLALLLCLAGDASAQERVTACNGLGAVVLAPAGNGWQRPATAGAWADGLDVHTLDLDGFRVVAQIWSYGNPAPDTLVVLPPAGWVAIPPTLDVGELQTGSVLLTMVGLS